MELLSADKTMFRKLLMDKIYNEVDDLELREDLTNFLYKSDFLTWCKEGYAHVPETVSSIFDAKAEYTTPEVVNKLKEFIPNLKVIALKYNETVTTEFLESCKSIESDVHVNID